MSPRRSPFDADELVQHSAFLRTLARGLVSDEAAADDLVQDTFVVALERPPRQSRSLRGWLATVARSLAHNRRRAEGRRQARERDVARPAQPRLESDWRDDAQRAALALEAARALARATSALEEPLRTVVWLRYHLGLSPAEIARRSNEPIATVKSRLTRAHRRLRAQLDADGADARACLLLLTRPRGPVGPVGSADPLDSQESVDPREPGGPAPLAPSAPAPLARTSAASQPYLIAGILMKKTTIALGGALLAAAAWFGLRAAFAPRHHTVSPGNVPGARLREPVLADAPSEPVAPARAPREVLPSADPGSARPAACGALAVQVRWARDGSPCANVCIDILPLSPQRPRRDRLHARTDEAGQVRFGDVDAGEVRVYSETGAAESVEVRAGETAALELAIPDDERVRGRVLDEHGAPLAGAQVWIHGPVAEASHAVATSGAGGAFELRGVQDPSYVGAFASGHTASPCADVRELPVAADGAREVELRLGAPGGTLAGRVLDASGEPVPGARVLIGPKNGYVLRPDGSIERYEAKSELVESDERGAFRHVGDLPAGSCAMTVAAEGHPLWEGSVDVVAGRASWVDVRLFGGARIVGRILGLNRTPVAGAHVVATREWQIERPSEALPVPEAHTDDAGLFVLRWLPPGPLELVASVPGRDAMGRARAAITVEEAGEQQVELALELAKPIRGRVVDAGGQPLAGWPVWGSGIAWEVSTEAAGFMVFEQSHRRDVTAADGTFVLGNFLGDRVDLRVAAPGESPIPPRAELLGVRPGTEGLVITVENAEVRPARLSGRLLDGSGRAPRGVMLTAYRSASSVGNILDFEAESGRFEFVATLPGAYELRVLHAGSTLLTAGPFELEAGGELDVGTLVLADLGRVEVHAANLDAKQRPSLALQACGPGGATSALKLQGDSFVSGALEPGAWRVRVGGEPWHAADVAFEVRPGETAHVEIEPVPGFEVDLSFDIAGGVALPSAVFVDIQDDAGGVRSMESAASLQPRADGAMRLGVHGLCLPAGHYAVRARTAGGLEASGDLAIRDPLTARGPWTFPLR